METFLSRRVGAALHIATIGLRRRGLVPSVLVTRARRARRRTLALVSAAATLISVSLLGTLGTTAGAQAVVPTITHAARISVAPYTRSPVGGILNTWAASNWSGYAETGTFTGVSGTWTVPSVASTSSATYSSTWIGVDGYNNGNLIQTGTEQDYYNGAAHYDAWWEILPAAETEISPSSYAVSPGDQMSSSIYETSATTTSRSRGFASERRACVVDHHL